MHFAKSGRWRDYLLFVLGINLGLRVNDLLKLRFSAILNRDRTLKDSIIISDQKPHFVGQKAIIWKVKLNPAVKEAVALYMSHSGGVNVDDYIFKSESTNKRSGDSPLHRGSVDRIIRLATQELNLDLRCSASTLRRTFAYQQLVRAEDYQAQALVARALGYRTIADTMNYAGTTEDEIRQAKRTYNPAANYFFNGSQIIESEIG